MKPIALIADDSPTVRKFVTFALKSMNIEVIPATDGMDALEKITNHKPDLIITDLNMPNVDGYELIQSLRNSEEYTDVPIIILSSESEEEDKLKGLVLGANAYVVKPLNTKKLQYEVSKFLSD